MCSSLNNNIIYLIQLRSTIILAVLKINFMPIMKCLPLSLWALINNISTNHHQIIIQLLTHQRMLVKNLIFSAKNLQAIWTSYRNQINKVSIFKQPQLRCTKHQQVSKGSLTFLDQMVFLMDQIIQKIMGLL